MNQFKKEKGDRFLFVGRFSEFKMPHIAIDLARDGETPWRSARCGVGNDAIERLSILSENLAKTLRFAPQLAVRPAAHTLRF